MKHKIAINGFGRIGRAVLRIIEARQDDLQVVAINDLSDAKTLAHLLKYDSIHGKFSGTIEVDGSALIVNGNKIEVFAERNPANLPWKALGVDVAIESTGIFTQAKSEKGGYLDHIDAGAKKVILTVPAKDDIATMVMGVNEAVYQPETLAWSNASCTTNCLAPLAKVLHEEFGLVKGFMNTVHAYTNDQNSLDGPHKDLRRARASAMSIIPTSTGAARAVSLVLPELKGKLDGQAMRVPVPDGSIVDLVCEVEKSATVETVNKALEDAAQSDLKGILDVSYEPLVSSDIIGNSFSSIVDASSTMVNGNMIKVVSWYDNEWGYSNRVVDLACKIIEKVLA